VWFAPVNHDAGASGEVHPVHQLMADWTAQILFRTLVPTHSPPHALHSVSEQFPTRTFTMFNWQHGQSPGAICSDSVRDTSFPHQGQCFIPAKIDSKQAGQPTVASDEPHHVQRTLPIEASPPQFGHFSVPDVDWSSCTINDWLLRPAFSLRQ
jgi:hypothetical protein